MGYKIFDISDLNSINLNELICNGVQYTAVPIYNLDRSQFYLYSDTFEDNASLSNEQLNEYLSLYANLWVPVLPIP